METKKSKKKPIIIAASVAALVALGIAAFLLLPKRNNSVVTTYPVSGITNEYAMSMSDSNITGTIVDQFSQNVVQRSDLKLKRIHVRRGQRVKKGTVLVTYDCRRDELEMKLKEIEVQKRERDIQARENALETLRRTGRDTYNDDTSLPGEDDDVDSEDDARLPETKSYAWALDNPLGVTVHATGAEAEEGDNAGQSGEGGDNSGTANDQQESGQEQGGSGGDSQGSGGDQQGSGQDQQGEQQPSDPEPEKSNIPSGVTPNTLIKALLGDNADAASSYSPDGSTLEVYIVKNDDDDLTDVQGQAIKDAIDIVKESGGYSTVVFKRFTKDQVETGGGPDAEVTVVSGTFLNPPIDSKGKYSLEDIAALVKQATGGDNGNMEITSSTKNATKKVSKGSSYTYKLEVDGEETSTDLVWSISGNKSKKTTIDSKTGKLTIDSGEKAKKIKITATINGQSVSKVVKVSSSSSSSNSSSSSSSSTSSTSNSGSGTGTSNTGDDIDTDDTVYTGDELRAQIEDREEQLEDARIELEEARIKYKEMKQKVDAATVKASMNGLITVAYTKNNLPESGKPIVVLKSKGGTYLQFEVNELDRDSVVLNTEVQCSKGSSDDYGFYDEEDGFEEDLSDEDSSSKKYKAIVTNIADYPSEKKQSYDMMYDYGSSNSNPETSSYTVTASIQNASGLTAGDVMRVTFDRKAARNKEGTTELIIMSPFIRQEGRRYYVYKIGKDDRLVKQYVKIGKTESGFTEILSGLKEDDYIAFPYSKDNLDQARTKKEEDTSEITNKLWESPEFYY